MRAVLIIILLVSVQVAFGQGKYDANWVFGFRCGLHFDSANNVSIFKPITQCDETNGSFSDSFGNLLYYLDNPGFYYNPYVIRNAFDSMVPNGDSINLSYYCTNGALIIPINGEKSILFELAGNILNSNCPPVCYQLSYSTIQIDSELPIVMQKNQLILNEAVESRMSAVRHANGKDWWLLVHAIKDTLPNNRFYEYLIHGDSIIGPITQDIGSLHSSAFSFKGEMTFSRDGTHLASVLGDQSEAELFSFDRCSGVIYNFINITNIDSGGYFYSCEFSPNSTKLYLVEGFEGNGFNGVFQYRIDTTDINSSEKIIWRNPPNPPDLEFGQLQIAPNNKIYLATHNGGTGYSDHLGVVSAPDSLGLSCNFLPFSFYLGDSSFTYYGLPNMPNYNLGPLNSIWQSTLIQDKTFICKGDSTTKGITLTIDTVPGVTFAWQPAPGIDSMATIQIVYPPQSTWYYVTFTDTSIHNSCNSRTDSVYVEIRNCDTTGISAPALITQHLFIYPNPAQNIATIEWQPVSERVQLCVTDLLGRVVRQAHYDPNIGKAQIDISGLANGLYVVKLISRDGAVVSGKLGVVR